MPGSGSSVSAMPRISYSRKIWGDSIQAQYSVHITSILTNGSGHVGMGAMVVILGLGFTGTRLARRLVGRGIPVLALVRGVERFPELANSGVELTELRGDVQG